MNPTTANPTTATPSPSSASSSPTLVTASFGLRRLVQALPAIHSIVASGREVALLVPDELRALAEQIPGVVAAPEISPSEQGSVEGILRAGCEEAVILDGSLDSAWLAQRAEISQRWGYGGLLRRWLLTSAVEAPKKSAAKGAGRYGPLLEALGAPLPESWVPSLSLPPALQEKGGQYLERARVEPEGGPLIAYAPTSEEVTAPRWPWKEFATLIRSMRKAHPSVRQVLIARSDELWPVVRIHEETARYYPVIGPDLSLPDLAAVLARVDLLVSPASGFLHLAAALGVPTVALLSRRAPAPPGPGHAILRGQSASGLLLFGLNYLGRNPLTGIDGEAVQLACEGLLGLL
ncbi:MAG: glycosyltransferase family 9 protein [Acidobacteriota bacterium]